jgi:hypothetical protein
MVYLRAFIFRSPARQTTQLRTLCIVTLVASIWLLPACPKPVPGKPHDQNNTRLKANRLDLGLVHNDSGLLVKPG